jgi:hypothetical protein
MRALSVLLLRPGGFFGDWSDFNYYREMAQLSDQGYYPYIHFWAEYPPVLPWLAVGIHRLSLLLPQWTHPMLWFQIGLSAVMIAAETGSLLLVRRIGARLWGEAGGMRCAFLYGALFLPFYGVMLWFDALPVFFLLLGLELVLARRPLLAGLACGAGIVTKLFPIVLAPVLAKDSQSVRRLVPFGAAVLAVVAAAYGPLFAASPEMTLASASGLVARQSWETIWALLDGYYGTGGVASLADRLFYPQSAAWGSASRLPWSLISVLFAGVYSAVWVLAVCESRRADGGASEAARARSLVALTAMTVALLLLYSRGFSQQYTLWLLPLIVLLAPTTRGILFAVALIACNALVEGYLFVTVFPRDQWLLRGTVLIRTALVAALAVEAGATLYPWAGRVWTRVKPAAVPAFAAVVGIIAIALGLRLWTVYWSDTLARGPSAGVIAAIQRTDATTPIVFLDRDAYSQTYAFASPRPMLLLADAKLPGRVGRASLHARLTGHVGDSPTVLLVTSVGDAAGPLAPAVAAWLSRGFAEAGRQTVAGRDVVAYRRAPLPQLATPYSFGDRTALTAISVDPDPLAPGQSARILLAWRGLAREERDLTVFLHLLDDRGQIVAQSDSQPLSGRYPTSVWQIGETVLDEISLRIPETTQSGSYALAVGLYHQPTGARMPARGPAVDADRAMPLTVRIRAGAP